MGAAGHAFVVYSGKSAPLAILAAAQKAGLEAKLSEHKDAKNDAPPILTSSDG